MMENVGSKGEYVNEAEHIWYPIYTNHTKDSCGSGVVMKRMLK